MRKVRPTKRKLYTLAAVALAVVLVVALSILFFFHKDDKGEPEKSDSPESSETGLLIYDRNAVEGGWEDVDTVKVLEDLNKKVAAGMINISMNTAPIFDDGKAAGNLMIVNESINRYPQVVEITRNDTGEIIYTSGVIPIGSKIEAARLDVALPAGAYECTAMFYNVDPGNGTRLGCAGASIQVIVLK